MCVVSINVPEEILLDLHENEDDFAAYTKCMLAINLYKKKDIFGILCRYSRHDKRRFHKISWTERYIYIFF